MNERKKPPPARNSTRTVAVIAVVVLIVVAIGGIVLAGRKPAEEAPPATVAAASAPLAVTTPEAASAPTGPPDNSLIFDAGSDKLPRDANEKINRVADAARASGNGARITARFLTGANKARDEALAKSRAGAVHHALMADGVSGEGLQIELVEMPAGSLTASASNRVEISAR